MSTSGPVVAISLTFPGSASLGAYQAGAASAVAHAVGRLRTLGIDARVTAVGGSSAGSIVGLLLAHGLATGRDVRTIMQAAWIDSVDMDLLRSGGADAPLSFTGLRQKLIDFLDDYDRFPRNVHEPLPEAIRLQVGLTSLLGYEVEDETDDGRIGRTLTYVDWTEHVLHPQHSTAVLHDADEADALPTPLDAALSSAAHPLGFKPSSLDRSDDRDRYLTHGVRNLPDGHTTLWYSDGGLIEARPVGRVISASRAALTEQLKPDVDRQLLHLVVDPLASGPSGQAKWAEVDSDPSWMETVRRSMAIVPTQPLHDDIRGVIDVNSRLDSFGHLCESLEMTPEQSDKILEWAGLSEKQPIQLGVISPRIFADERGVDELLTGDFIGAFGGFLDRSIRRSDFALGWMSAATWLESFLPSSGVDEESACDVSESLRREIPNAEDQIITEDDGIDVLDWKGRWRLALLAAQFSRVAVSAATPSIKRLRRSNQSSD